MAKIARLIGTYLWTPLGPAVAQTYGQTTALQQTPNHHFIFSTREPSTEVCPHPAQTLASISRTRGGEQTAATKELVWSLERLQS